MFLKNKIRNFVINVSSNKNITDIACLLKMFDLAIFTYHWVGPKKWDSTGDLWNIHSVTDNEFEAQMKYISEHFNVVNLDDILDSISYGRIMKNSVAITFDDGYSCLHDVVEPILLKYSVPATVFVSGKFIDNQDLYWRFGLNLLVKHGFWNTFLHVLDTLTFIDGDLTNLQYKYIDFGCGISSDLAEQAVKETFGKLNWDTIALAKDTRLFLTKNDLFQLNKQIWTIGHHTWSHSHLVDLDWARQEEEIAEGLSFIENYSGINRNYFAIPFGAQSSYNKTTLQICENLGCKLILTSSRGFEMLPLSKQLKRIPAPRTYFDMRGYLSTLHPDIWYSRLARIFNDR